MDPSMETSYPDVGPIGRAVQPLGSSRTRDPVASSPVVVSMLERLARPDTTELGVVADAMVHPYVVTTEDGSVVGANASGAALFRGADPVGMSFPRLFMAVERECVHGLLDRPGPDLVVETFVLADGRRAETALAWDRSPSGSPAAHWLLQLPADHVVEPDLGLPVTTYTCEAGSAWRCVSVSARLETLIGVSPDEWVADPHRWLELVEPEDRERLIEARVRASEPRTPVRVLYRLRAASGRLVWVRDEAMIGADGLARGILADASVEHQRDQVLVQLHEAAAQQVQVLRSVQASRSLLFRTFAHDVRSAAVGGRAILRRIEEDQSEGVEAVWPELRAALDRVLSRVVGLSHGVIELEGRGLPLGLQRVDLGELLRDAAEQVDAAGREVIVDVPRAAALVDPVAVSRIVVNLVKNSVQYTPAGSTIRVWGRRTTDGVVIVVEDDGPGIGESDRERIFEPLVRASSDADGLGLGLSFVKQLAQLHGGDVRVEDVPGGGAAFVVTLPQPR
jgi:signal transduction histidine kinase